MKSLEAIENTLETIENSETMLPASEAKRKKQKGASAVEYAILLFLVAIVLVGFGAGIGNSINMVFSQIQSGLIAG